MKRVVLILLFVFSLALFAACNTAVAEDEVKRIEKPETEVADSGTVTESNTVAKEETETAKTYTGYGYHALGTSGEGDIYIGMPAEEMESILGEAKGYFEAPSCALEGMDKVYTYEHCEIYVSEFPDEAIVTAIYLTDDLTATMEGLAVGDKDARMKELYGEKYQSDGYEYSYRKGDMSLNIQISVGKVSYIYYMWVNKDK